MNVVERFLKYVSYDTRSDEHSETFPSTEKQKVLGAELVREMQALGLESVKMDENGYVFGFLPATKDFETLPIIGLIAHMDTSPDVSGKDVSPRLVRYEGGVIELGHGEELSPEKFPFLEKFIGQELIVTDGSTLLGADDKAGIAEIMSACAYLVAHPEVSHPGLAIGFTPDEEIGCGADRFDVEKFGADFAYTVDGGFLGEIEYENFNAASARLTVKGVNIHPGSAKNQMKNALLMACEWISRLPAAETPSHTEGYEGFFHVHDMQANECGATVDLLIRDHDRASFEERKRVLERLTAYENSVWGEGSFTLSVKDSYYNMKEQILPHMELIENAKNAMLMAGVEPMVVPIRGGTDGARLSYMGLPCPNLSTGGANFHGIHEFVSADAMKKMVEVLVNLVSVN